MTSFIACSLVIAFAVLHCAAAVTLPSVSYTLDFSAGIGGVVTLVVNLVGDIIANLGIAGVTSLLNGFVSGLSGTVGDLLGFVQIQEYAADLVSALLEANVVTQVAGGLLEVVEGAASIDITGIVAGALGGLLGTVGVLAGALVASLGGVAGGLIGGLIGGVSAVLPVAVDALNILLGLIDQVKGVVSCAAEQCLNV